MRSLVAGAVLLSSTVAGADEGPLVLVLEPARAVPGLPADDVADALDVSLGDLGIRARTGPPGRSGSAERQLEAAKAMGRDARALAVVWYAPAEDGDEVLVHVLDLRAGRATFQALRVRPAGDESAARVLALKVRFLLRVALVERASDSRAVRSLVAPLLAKVARPRTVLRSSLDYAASPGPSGVRQGPGGTVFVEVLPRLEAALALAFLDAPEAELTTGSVQTDEVTAALCLQVTVVPGAVDLRAGPIGRMHFLAANGTARDGRRGSRRAYVPEVGLAVSSRAHLHEAVALGASFSVGWLFGRERFLLLGEEAFDLGRVGLELRLGLVTPGG